MASPDTLCFKFPKAADNKAVGGSAHNVMVNRIMPETEVLILSDIDHSKNTSMFHDVFGDGKIVGYAKQGVTDIHIELFPRHQMLINDLSSKSITAPQFVEAMLAEGGVNAWLSEADQIKQTNDLAKLIVTAQENGIKIHASMQETTPEQHIRSQNMMLESQGKFGEVLNTVDEYIDTLNGLGFILPEEDVNTLYGLADDFLIGAEDYDGNVVGNIYDATQSMDGQYPDIQELRNKIISLKSEQWEIDNDLFIAETEYGIENDVHLAAYIADSRTGKAIVMHGSDHGANNNNDLDEHLQSRVGNVARVNMLYGDDEVGLNLTEKAKDPAEFDYHLGEDRLYINDRNDDGCLEGAPAAIQLDQNISLQLAANP